MDLQAALLAHNKGAHRKEDAEAVADWRRIKEDAGRGNPEGNKGGAGRVCIAKEFGIVHAYTIEASCNVSQASAGHMATGSSYNLSDLSLLFYLPGHHGEVGKAIGMALLEMDGVRVSYLVVTRRCSTSARVCVCFYVYSLCRPHLTPPTFFPIGSSISPITPVP